MAIWGKESGESMEGIPEHCGRGSDQGEELGVGVGGSHTGVVSSLLLVSR